MLKRLWFPASVRARLLLAFAILAVAALILAVAAWWSLSNTESALRGFDERVLPEISRSLELAERTANLAALAPYVSEATSPFLLQGESERLKSKAKHVMKLAQSIPELEAEAPRLSPLMSDLQDTLSELISHTRQDLFLREDMRQYLFRMDRLRQRIDGDGLDADVRGPVRAAMDALLAGTTAGSEQAIGHFRDGLQSHLAGLGGRAPGIAREIRAMGTGKDSVFGLRRKQLALQQRKAYLLATTRAISERLSSEVTAYVNRLQDRVADQSASVSAAVTSGKTGIALIGLLCMVAAGLGVYLVRRLVRNLKAVTGLMTRLAEGDTGQATPATDRRDEIGALARAFHVFRENAVALKDQSRLLETVFNNMNDGLSVFDGDGRLLTWNPQYVQILELPPGRIHKGVDLDEVQRILPPVAHENRTLTGSTLQMDAVNARRLATPQTFERYYANGRVVEFRSRPMPDGGFVTLYSDLTDRKAVEAQLRQSQKMEVLGQLTGGVAHDFNNLLAAVIGNLQMLEERSDLEPRARRYVERALAAADRGASLTGRLLAFARRQQLRPEATEVDALVKGMQDLVEYSVGPGVEIETRTAAPGVLVYVDPGQLENALLNLAINASAAMPDGGRLGFATRQVDGDDGPTVAIEVSDTGCGIPEGQLERVFEPFYTTKDTGEGSGLGLSIVYGFVKQSGGDVRVDSRVGEGTSIVLTLPLLPADAVFASQGEGTSVEKPVLPPMHVLVVEDDPQVRDVACELLGHLGHRVTAVACLEDAMAAVA
ncbi:MAG TPA: PAS-domain containing protein, partial [Gammaproteobacteria bacterium]|nr:PAS-domain containing protein [Gammaproteobacteria bacterium]